MAKKKRKRKQKRPICSATWLLAGILVDYFAENLSTQTGPSVHDAIDREELSRLVEKHAIHVALDMADRDCR